MSNLIVADVAVRQDDQGRYCLNDLHKAAGGDDRHKPANFTRLAETKALFAELVNCSDVSSYTVPLSSVGGRYGGTFVVKELVYAYAMWISPAFHLKVIRAYDELQTQGVAFSDKTVAQVESGELDEEAVVQKAMTILQNRVERLKQENATLQNERNGVVKTIGKYAHTINQVVRKLDGVNTNATKGDLKRLGYLYKLGPGAYRVYRKYNHLFTERFDEATGRGNIYCTPEGKALLARLYEEGKLTMKAGYRVA
ncbi:TPA: KilA-N domain-containing protein [Klebsiella pneumoniae]|nr:KilA-N domain-containing protein [Klebsiella pneumoniae]